MTIERQTEAAREPEDAVEALRAELHRVERDYETRLRELANLAQPAPSPEASLGPYHLMLDLERARADLVARVNDLEDQLARSEEERHRVTAELERVAAERDAQAERLSDLEPRALDAERRAAELDRRLTLTLESWSWRIGRRIVTTAQRLRPGR